MMEYKGFATNYCMNNFGHGTKTTSFQMFVCIVRSLLTGAQNVKCWIMLHTLHCSLGCYSVFVWKNCIEFL